MSAGRSPVPQLTEMTRDDSANPVRGGRARHGRWFGAAAPGFAMALCLVAATGLAGGCGAAPAGPIRLIDELESAQIDSPLLGLEAWETVQAGLTDRPFWKPRLKAGKAVSRFCRAVSETEVSCQATLGNPYRMSFWVQTEPYSHYRIEARARGDRRQCATMQVGDRRQKRLLRIPPTTGRHERFSQPWHTGSSGGPLRLSFRGGCPISVDSIEVLAQDVDDRQELSLLAAQSPSAFANNGLGMAKFGALLPGAKAESVAPPFDENWGFREAILAPTPTDIRYSLAVPREGRLRFSYALSELSRVGDRVRFQVLAGRPDGEQRELWSRELALTEESWHWHEAEVDLGELAGGSVDLTLRTRAPGDRGYALWGSPTIDRPRRPDEPPNIVLIAVDTLRADRLSSYGYESTATPHLDALARDGTLFLDPISPSTQTPPSFASLFTGQLVARHGFLFATSKLAPGLPTLARVLRQNGWTTHAVAFHAALHDRTLARGFERYFNLPRTRHRADQNLAKGLEFLAAHGDRRFFFFLHFSDPHQPFTHPPEFVREETAAALTEHGVELPFNLRGSIGECPPCAAEGGIGADFRRVVRDLYDEEVAYVDAQIGSFLQALKDRDLYDDTIIVFTSDHGETLWDHYDVFGHGGFNQHDALTRVPLIVKPAAGRGYASGRVVRTQVRSFALMPTVLEMVGIDTALLRMDAQSLVPLLEEGDTSPQEEPWALTSNEQAASLRGRGWKWTWASRMHGTREGAEGLFDLAGDPFETTNVAAQNPRVLQGMRGRYMEMRVAAAGGRYLLILVDDEAGEYRVAVRVPGSGSWRPDPIDTVGLQRRRAPEDTSAYDGRPLVGGLLLFAEIPPSNALPIVEVTRGVSGGDPADTEVAEVRRVTFAPGAITGLLADGAPGVYLIDGRSREDIGGAEGSEQLDATREAALRALGYIQ